MTRKMKDSGIEWIGEIPEDWEIIKIKNLATENNTLFMDGDWIESHIIEDYGVRYLTTGNIGSGFYKEQGNGYISEETFKELRCLEVLPNDLVISRLNKPIGRACIIPDHEEKFVIAVDNVVLRPNKNYNKKYIMYSMNTNGHNQEAANYSNGATMLRISRTELGNLLLPLPAEQEQKAIADFLDKKTAEIDNIVSKTKKSIEEYKKYKQSLITETVTKGLDKNVEMKDSGIEWVGEIPNHWDLIKLKYLVNCNEQTLSSKTSDDYEFRYIDIGSVDFHKGIIGYENMKYNNSPSRARRIVKEGDLIVSTVRTYLRAIATIEDADDVIVSTGFAVLTPKNVREKYLEYMTKTEYFISEVIKNSVGVSYPAINSKELLEIKISFPPLKEQEQIASYLDEKTNQIDQIISTKEKLLTEMEAYKKSLIYETVTGKREVE